MIQPVKVQYYAAATLDGYIADSDDGLGWLFGYDGTYEGDDVAAAGPMSPGGGYEEFYEGVGAMISGSTTYEWVLENKDPETPWPYAGKPYWVLSSRELAATEGEDVRVVKATVEEVHDEIATAAGERNLWILGGGGVASQYAEAGLLDELILTVVPVVIGGGKQLFDRELPVDALNLRGTRTFGNGMVELTYAVKR